jgi:hypothetical protein
MPLAEPTPPPPPPPPPVVAAAADAPVPPATPPTDVKPATADSAAAAAAVTPLLATANDEPKPTKREFTGEDYLMWFSNTFSMDKPRQMLVKAPYFGVPAPPPGDGTDGEDAAAGKKEMGGKEGEYPPARREHDPELYTSDVNEQNTKSPTAQNPDPSSSTRSSTLVTPTWTPTRTTTTRSRNVVSRGTSLISSGTCCPSSRTRWRGSGT